MKWLTFILHFIVSISLFAPANNTFEAENIDLSTGMTTVAARVKKVHNLRTEEKFCDIWDEVVTQIDAHSRHTRLDNTLLQDHVKGLPHWLFQRQI